MRWSVEGVDFEPAGKDHHSEGGSFSTSKGIARKVYDHEPPVTFQYDFLSIKGRGGKISSSSGEVISQGCSGDLSAGDHPLYVCQHQT